MGGEADTCPWLGLLDRLPAERNSLTSLKICAFRIPIDPIDGFGALNQCLGARITMTHLGLEKSLTEDEAWSPLVVLPSM